MWPSSIGLYHLRHRRLRLTLSNAAQRSHRDVRGAPVRACWSLFASERSMPGAASHSKVFPHETVYWPPNMTTRAPESALVYATLNCGFTCSILFVYFLRMTHFICIILFFIHLYVFPLDLTDLFTILKTVFRNSCPFARNPAVPHMKLQYLTLARTGHFS